MSYYPSIAIFQNGAPMTTLAKAILTELGSEFEFLSEPLKRFIDDGAMEKQSQARHAELSEFGISRPPHNVVFSGTLPSGNLEMRIWDSDPDDSGEVSESVKDEWRAIALKLHRIIIKSAGAFLSYTSVFDHHYPGSPSAYELGEMLRSELKEKRALKHIVSESGLFWIVGVNKLTCGDEFKKYGAELAKDFRLVEDDAEFVLFENREYIPAFLML